MTKYYKPQLDDLVLAYVPQLKGKKNTVTRPCLVLEVADGYVLLLPFSTQDSWYDEAGKYCTRGPLDVRQEPYGKRDQYGWLAFDTAAWYKLDSYGELVVANPYYGYANKKNADQAWQGWLKYCKATGYKPPFFS